MDHCKDCCCAQCWEALGISQYTGKSIPEHIVALRLALVSAEIELEYCHSVMGNNRMFTRAIVLAKIKKALGDTQ